MSEQATALFSTMTEASSFDTMATLLAQHYGLSGQLSRLNSERDENFHLQASDGVQYVVKLSHPAEPRTMTDFQTQALLYALEQDPALPIPRVIARRDGQPWAAISMPDGPERVLRVLSYLDGKPLHQVVRTVAQRRHLGTTLARLDKALAGFQHPAAHHDLLWDIQHCERLRTLAEGQEPQFRQWLDHFEYTLKPRLASLRRQVIHNDLNPHNVLLDPVNEVSTAGLIDFGDMVHAPLVNELAVACSYQLSGNGNPLDSAADLIAAYHAENPLTVEEVGLLYDLILTRLYMTVTITDWRALRHPENRSYILRNNGISRDGFIRLSALGREQATRYLRDICSMKGQA
ncbi:MAG: phosphotransferase [Aquitalea sp.]|nr:phosphotransferase [Aquitalea sp.]